ncbi:ankyrin repeat domain-containing protein [Candidatus Dependentiae bacterium]|nr:MAG: ankyrin repeat domain-containing protein [Candidatus Dependentiae bacterium]
MIKNRMIIAILALSLGISNSTEAISLGSIYQTFKSDMEHLLNPKKKCSQAQKKRIATELSLLTSGCLALAGGAATFIWHHTKKLKRRKKSAEDAIFSTRSEWRNENTRQDQQNKERLQRQLTEANKNNQDEHGLTELHKAAGNGYTDSMQYLIHGLKVSIEILNDQHWTPLHCAAAQNQLNALRILVDAKANMNAMDQSGTTPLHIAIRNGKPEAATFLIEHEAQLDTQDKAWNTPLHYAAARGDQEVVKLLIARGATEKCNLASKKPSYYAQDKRTKELFSQPRKT